MKVIKQLKEEKVRICQKKSYENYKSSLKPFTREKIDDNIIIMNYNKFNVNFITIIISIILFLIINYFLKYPIENKNENTKTKQNDDIVNINKINIKDNANMKNTISIKSNCLVEVESNITNWKLIIPKLNLNAQIKEGTTENIISSYIGHYENTSIDRENIGLIAYNFKKNSNIKNYYFANLKELNAGDKIIYQVNEKIIEYMVVANKILDKNEIKNEIEMKYEKDVEKYIKLVTFVIDLPEKMRCVIAKE